MRSKDTRRARRIVREKFGFEEFRPGQEAAIKAVLNGHDTLAILPTGLGKSMIYQVAALLLTGPTVVVSPLIALQHDQVEAIEEHHVGEAALVNSTMREAERQEVFQELKAGELNFLFLAPEQFSNKEILASLQAAHPALFVVDEAHCISEWGHDFRPEYLHLGITVAEDEKHVPFPINSRVIHKSWGTGMVLRYEGDKMVVLFDDVGYKTLAVDLVSERGILVPQ